jgi:hypothetical protein
MLAKKIISGLKLKQVWVLIALKLKSLKNIKISSYYYFISNLNIIL